MINDSNKIRKDFPMFSQNSQLVYFDNAATTFKPKSVVDKTNEYYHAKTTNIHRGDYDLSIEVSDLVEKARENIADFVHASSSEVVFTAGTTDSINKICFGYAKQVLKKGDVILTTFADHASNLLPWFELSKEIGCNVEYIELTSTGKIEIENVKKALHDKVKIVAIAHITNVMGQIAPIKEITNMVHEMGGLVIVDGAQSVAHMPVDVADLDIDFLSFSGHKMIGPTGIGVLYGKYKLLEIMKPLIYGGGSNARFDKEGNLLLKPAPCKFESGTLPIAEILGLSQAVTYLKELSMDHILKHEQHLRNYLVTQLRKMDRIHVYNEDAETGIVAFNVKDIFPQDVSVYLNSFNIAVRAGDHCAKLLHNLIGTPNTVRVSLYFYNTLDEIDYFVKVMKEITLEKCIDLAI